MTPKVPSRSRHARMLGLCGLDEVKVDWIVLHTAPVRVLEQAAAR